MATMPECSVFPIFEADQVLRADQLNQLRDYLEQQERTTRTHLLGVGIVCGLDVTTDASVLRVDEGIGISSEGYLLALSADRYDRKRPFAAPGNYPPLSATGVPSLYELVPADGEASDEMTPLDAMDLQGGVVLLYLERTEIDSDACTGSGCDQQGITVELCPRLLLIPRSFAATLLRLGGQSFPHGYSVHALCDAWEKLPSLYVGRPIGLWEKHEAGVTAANVSEAYRRVLGASYRAQLNGTLAGAHHTFQTLLGEPLSNPFSTISLPQDGAEQYHWDHVQDVVAAYEEWRSCAFELAHTCCPDASSFPRHLLLGPAQRTATEPERTLRHVFMKVEQLDRGGERLAELRALYRRLVSVVNSFSLPTSAEPRITPSASARERLGLRAIPYYYPPSSELRRVWDPARTPRGETRGIHSYWSNQYSGCSEVTDIFDLLEPVLTRPAADLFADARDPRTPFGPRKIVSPRRLEDGTALDFITGRRTDRERLRLAAQGTTFYRIEGHLGRDVSQVRAKLEADILCYQLPFRVTTRKLGSKAPSSALPDCLVQDLQVNYRTQRAAWLCRLGELSTYLGSLKIQTRYSGVTSALGNSVIGRITDAMIKGPLVGATVRLEASDRSTFSKADGSFVLRDLPPGENYLIVTQDGFQPKRIPILVEPGLGIEFDGDSAIEVRAGSAPPRSAIASAGVTRAAKAAPTKRGPETLDAIYEVLGGRTLADKGWGPLESFTYESIAKVTADTYQALIQRNQPLLELRAGIDTVVEALTEEFQVFDATLFEGRWAALRALCRRAIASLPALQKTSTLDEQAVREIVQRLRLLDELSCADPFDDLALALGERRTRYRSGLLLGPFARKHPGLEHRAGVDAGGTFVLAYDDRGVVIADFSLPYPLEECCDGAAPRTQTVFTLPSARFCADDPRAYRFTTFPPGGSVSGAGVSRDPQTGDYSFVPSSARAVGVVRFSYLLDGVRYTLEATLEQLTATFTYELVGRTEQGMQVQLRAQPPGAQYAWSFGDGGDSDLQEPLYTFPPSQEGTDLHEVTLVVTRGPCVKSVVQTLALGAPNAEFSVEELAATPASISFRFRAIHRADSYLWEPEGAEPPPGATQDLTFTREQLPYSPRVKLTVSLAGVQDTREREVYVPARQALQFDLPKQTFCTHDRASYPFLLAPEGGAVEGAGVVVVEGRPSFMPSDPTLSAGPQLFRYRVGEGEPQALTVELLDVHAELAYEIREVDVDRGSAVVLFSAEGSRYRGLSWSFGDRETSNAKVVERSYDTLDDRSVELTVRDGECTESASSTITFPRVDATFATAIQLQGADALVTFTAREAGNERYRWDHGDQKQEEGGAQSQRTYTLLDTAQPLRVGLETSTGPAHASSQQTLTLPARIAPTLALESADVCINGSVRVVASPAGGLFSLDVERTSDGLRLYPRRAGLQRGAFVLRYTLNGVSVEAQGVVRQPRAVSLPPIAQREGGTYLVRFPNGSEDASRYEWVFHFRQDIVSGDAVPSVRFDDVSPGDELKYELRAIWDDDCFDVYKGSYTFPPLEKTRPSAGELVGPVRADTRASQRKLLQHERLQKVFPRAEQDEHLAEADKLLGVLDDALTDPARATQLTDGTLARQVTNQLTAALSFSQRQLEAAQLDREDAPVMYALYRVLLGFAVGFAGMQTTPLTQVDALIGTLRRVPRTLQGARKLGVELDADGSLAKALELAAELATSDVTSHALSAIRGAL
jgi:hypothetical protein